MTRISGSAVTALQQVVALKAATDQKIDSIQQEALRLQQEQKIELAKAVRAALADGVPQLQLSKQGLGYNHGNGLRSYFNLPMAGDVRTLMDEFLQRATGTLGQALGALPATTPTTLLYPIEKHNGYPTWQVERAGVGPIGQVRDARKDGMMVWYDEGSGLSMNREEFLLVAEQLKLKESFWDAAAWVGTKGSIPFEDGALDDE